MSGVNVSVDEYLKKIPGSYLRNFTYDGKEHRVIVQPIPGGKGYAPLDLYESGDIGLAALVAKAAFDARL